MASFEELGVAPELVEALAAEGIETPSAFQESALPVLLRENSLMAQAGPGAGTLIAYGLPILQSVDPEANSAQALVLTASPQGAFRLAQSLSRLAQVTGHRVAALGTPWALPNLANILFTTPEDLLKEVRGSSVAVDGVRFVVVDGFNALLPAAQEAMETLFEILPKEGQRAILGQPLSEEAEAFGRAHIAKGIHIPPKAVGEDSPGSSPHRGQIQYRITGESKEIEVLQTVSGAMEAGVHHVLLFTRSEDQAADMGDFLTLHGFISGAPGDSDCPVWLGVAELAARKSLEGRSEDAPIITVSLDVPADADSLDRRHGGGEGGTVLVRSRELLHLQEVSRQAGYTLIPAKEPLPTRVAGELDRLRGLLGRTLKEEELAPHFLALESLFEEHSPGEVAAAALFLLHQKGGAGALGETLPTPSAGDEKGSGPAPKTWVRLFVGVGEKEEIGPGDLLGAIAGEAGVDGSQVGKIEIRENFSLVEVISSVAERVVKGINGTTIRGRSVRVDYDRGGPAGRGGQGSRGGRPQGPSGGASGGPGGGPGGKPVRDGPRRRLKGDGPRDS
jgi:ATP-dependent RNA helicase DeaD